MTDKEVCRYLELVDRRLFIIVHSGTDWKPEYGPELEAFDRELAELRVLVEKAHEQWPNSSSPRQGKERETHASSKEYGYA